MVRHGDNNWADIVRWTHYAMLLAEEYHINKSNVDKILKSTKDPEVLRLLGGEGSNSGDLLKLNKDWAYQIIKQVGNYGEVFETNLGDKSPLKIKRGLNQIWSLGGLQYPMPVR